MKDPGIYIDHILESIGRIRSYASGGREAFLGDNKTQDAVVRNLQVIAESAQRIPEPVRERCDGVDWKAIRGFRNVLVHDYLGLNMKQIWDVIEKDIPGLQAGMERLKSEIGKTGG